MSELTLDDIINSLASRVATLESTQVLRNRVEAMHQVLCDRLAVIEAENRQLKQEVQQLGDRVDELESDKREQETVALWNIPG